MRVPIAVLALLSLATFSVSAHADTLTFTESGLASGSMNVFGFATIPFSDAPFVITATYDSNDAVGGFQYLHPLDSLTYTIGGVTVNAVGTFHSYDYDVIILNSYIGEFYVQALGYNPVDVLDFSSTALLGGSLGSPFGPVTGSGTVYGTTSDVTTGGFLTFTSIDGPVTLTVTGTPEPSSLVLLSTGVLGLAGAARRRFRR